MLPGFGNPQNPKGQGCAAYHRVALDKAPIEMGGSHLVASLAFWVLPAVQGLPLGLARARERGF